MTMRRGTALWLGLSLTALAWCAPQGAGQKPQPVDFTRDVQPVLKAHCLSCHGGNQKQGGLSLDSRALAGTTIVPGKSARSPLLQRVLGHGGKPRMPLGFAPLAPEKVAVLRRWIDEGARWPEGTSAAQHWAYRPLRRPLEPPVAENGIDAFIAARLQKEGLAFSPEADRITLLRRVTLDLTGLPPTPKEVAAFVSDTRPGAYEKVVERLLASPHYGEKLALPWLDAARYADSNGFQQDGDTFQYVWRDWVVKAFNTNMPFDQFTIEQLAGDLLPNPTLDQLIATGFNRCHLLNGEGGAIPEEQRFVILFDRVDVTATTWLGVTLACAQCHDHKYDPLTQVDYYRFMAYFNNVPETGVPPGGGQYRIAEPFVVAGDSAQRARLAQLETELVAATAALRSAEQKPVGDAPRLTLTPWVASAPFSAASFDAAYATEQPLPTPLTGRSRPELADGVAQVLELGDNTALYLERTLTVERAVTIGLTFGSDDAIKVWVNGALVLANKVTRGVVVDQERVSVALKAGVNSLRVKIVNGGGPAGFAFRLDAPVAPEVKAARDKVAELTREKDTLTASLPRVMVMSDARPRVTHVLDRGNYEAPRAEVTAGLPTTLSQRPAPNRLGLARWLVSDENPLTARVMVNRLWQVFFGNGLVKTSENFGVQSEPPSHPELLDWLASDFRSDWDIKRLVRQIVLSRTYRQSSKVTPQLRQRDPENRLLARGARFRLSSLLLRDIALSASGLLNPELGGKPVYPYQPKDIWDGLAITKERDFTYPQSTGKDLYRRSLYTFWRRTVAPGNMFDASARQTCKVRLAVTNTPLHALTTLNDITWVEAGRALAQRVYQEGHPDLDSRLSAAFRYVSSRSPKPAELAILRRSYLRNRIAFELDPNAAAAYLKSGASPRDEKIEPIAHAALASVCHALFNLDEALTRE